MTNSANWERLAKLVETVGHGEIRLVVQNGQPVRAELIVKSIRLDSPDEFEKAVDLMTL